MTVAWHIVIPDLPIAVKLDPESSSIAELDSDPYSHKDGLSPE
jgi:hypothetical protein